MKDSGYKYLEQTADARIFVWADDFILLLKEAAQGVINLIIDTKKIEPKAEIDIEIEGKDNEEILFNLLSEILYIIDSKSFIMKEITMLDINNGTAIIHLIGDSTENYVFQGEVKAITYHDFFVERTLKGNYKAQVVVDL